MNYRQERESLRNSNLANWNTLSNAAVASIYGRCAWRYGEQRPAKRSSPTDGYSPAERALYMRMRSSERVIYGAIRMAAEAGECAPSYRDLETTHDIGSATSVNKAIRALESMGALRRLASRPRLAFELPLAGLETATKGLRIIKREGG